MNIVRTLGGALLLVTGIGFSACGGGMQHRVDDSVLADVPLDQKQPVMSAKTMVDQANEEVTLAQSKIETDNRDLAVAEAAQKQAQLDVDKAKAGFQMAQQRGEVNYLNQQQQVSQVARLGVDTAQARIDALKKRRELHESQVNVAKAHRDVADANYQLTKAQLAQQLGRRPSSKYTVGDYQNQLTEAERRHQDAIAKMQALQNQEWQQEQRFAQLAYQYNQARDRLPEPKPLYVPPSPSSTEQQASTVSPRG